MLNVNVDHLLVGSLFNSEEDENTFLFGYNKNILSCDAVSLTMPITMEQYAYHNHLHPIFEMNLPEGALLERLRKLFSKPIAQFNDLKLLAIVGQSQIGRLTFGEKKDIPAIELDEILKYHGTQDLFESLLNRYITCSGISGAQPKIMVRVAESSSSNLERITHKSATHIVKTWDAHDYPELAFNEYFCMLAAKYSQLEVPEFYLSDNRKFFVIQRFDIQDGSYLGFEDFCVLNAFGTQQKYDSSYERICKRIKEFVSPSEMLVSLESFYKSLVLSCIVKNGDAHLKNFGVLYSDTESIVKLAPVYDIVSTTPYLAEDTLALTLDGSKRWPNQKKLLTFAVNHCGISKQRAQELIDRVSDGVFIALQELKQYASTRQELSDIGELIGNAWESGLSLTNPSKLLPK